MITSAAMKNGFTGGLIVDFPNSKKAKKYFLFLMAGYSEQIIKEAEEAVYLPKARTDGEDYDFDEDADSDSDMDAENGDAAAAEEDKKEDGEESKSEGDDDTSEEEDARKYKKPDHQIKQVGRRRDSKAIQKAKKQEGRWKPNGNRKNKSWIMKKKDRQRRQGVVVKADSKYSGRKRPRW